MPLSIGNHGHHPPWSESTKTLLPKRSQLLSLPAKKSRFKILQCQFLKHRKDTHKGYVLKRCIFSAATVDSSTLHANKTEQVPTSTSPNPSCFPLWDYEDGHLFTTGSVIQWYDEGHKCIQNDQTILFFIANIVWSQNGCHSSSHQTGESLLKQETQGSEGSSLSTGKRNWGFHWKERSHRTCYTGSSHVPMSGDF